MFLSVLPLLLACPKKERVKGACKHVAHDCKHCNFAAFCVSQDNEFHPRSGPNGVAQMMRLQDRATKTFVVEKRK